MALTGKKLLHARSAVPGAVPAAGSIVAGQIFLNTADKLVFILDSTGAVSTVASAAAVAKALSAIQTVNGQSPTAGAVTLTPAQIGTNGVLPLNASQKIDTIYLPSSVLGNVDYIGTWNAATNTPTLPDPTTVKGNYYVVTTAGTQFGNTYAVGDWAISNGAVWQQVSSHNAVTSVNGQGGAVVLTAASVNALDLTAGGTVAGPTIFSGTVQVPTATLGSQAINLTQLNAAISASGGGTVTSVNVTSSATNIITFSGGPVTSSGAIALALVTQAPNTVFAGPATGSTNAAPTFRALTQADIPDLDEGVYA